MTDCTPERGGERGRLKDEFCRRLLEGADDSVLTTSLHGLHACIALFRHSAFQDDERVQDALASAARPGSPRARVTGHSSAPRRVVARGSIARRIARECGGRIQEARGGYAQFVPKSRECRSPYRLGPA
jgi:hypothetical protein